jgi:hypothetical protein
MRSGGGKGCLSFWELSGVEVCALFGVSRVRFCTPSKSPFAGPLSRCSIRTPSCGCGGPRCPRGCDAECHQYRLPRHGIGGRPFNLTIIVASPPRAPQVQSARRGCSLRRTGPHLLGDLRPCPAVASRPIPTSEILRVRDEALGKRLV